MIIILILLVILLLGIMLYKMGNAASDLDVVGIILSVFASLCLFISLIAIIASHATASKTIQENKLNYDGLCKRYEIIKSEYEDVSKSDVISDITSWNIEVYNTKYWTENPWTSWSNPREIADNLEYIPLE